jgi:hypothetical protein
VGGFIKVRSMNLGEVCRDVTDKRHLAPKPVPAPTISYEMEGQRRGDRPMNDDGSNSPTDTAKDELFPTKCQLCQRRWAGSCFSTLKATAYYIALVLVCPCRCGVCMADLGCRICGCVEDREPKGGCTNCLIHYFPVCHSDDCEENFFSGTVGARWDC